MYLVIADYPTTEILAYAVTTCLWTAYGTKDKIALRTIKLHMIFIWSYASPNVKKMEVHTQIAMVMH